MACCIGLMLLASCKKDPVAPTINVFNGSGYVTENAQVFSGDEITVGFVASGENLTRIEVSLLESGTVLTTHIEDIQSLASYNYSHTFTVEATGTVTVTGTVTDATGQTATKSFNILVDEKPNAKFVGNYQGNALFTGTMEVAVVGMEPMQQEVTDHEMPVTLSITEGENINEVVAVCKMNNQESTAKGTVDGDKVSFVLTEVPYTFDYDMGYVPVSPTIIMNLNLTATLVDSQLNLEGTCNGDGEIHLTFPISVNGTIAIDGTIGGSLDKIE